MALDRTNFASESRGGGPALHTYRTTAVTFAWINLGVF